MDDENALSSILLRKQRSNVNSSIDKLVHSQFFRSMFSGNLHLISDNFTDVVSLQIAYTKYIIYDKLVDTSYGVKKIGILLSLLFFIKYLEIVLDEL